MALDVSIGGSSSESYATVTELDAYLPAMYGATHAGVVVFVALATAAKEQRLKLAALMMNTMPWRGAKASRDQRLEFPRWWRTDDEYDYVSEDEDYFINYSDITENAPTTPTEIKNAQCEIAYQVVDHILSLDPLSFPEQTIKSFELGGSLAIEFFGSVDSPNLSKNNLSSLDIIYAHVGKWYKRITGGVA